MHARTRLGRPVWPPADSLLDHLIDALAACGLPAVQHLPCRARRQYRQRPCWKSILRRQIKETSFRKVPLLNIIYIMRHKKQKRGDS